MGLGAAAVASHVRRDHAVSRCCERANLVAPRIPEFGPAVHQHHQRAVSLLSDPVDPEVQAHLDSCPRCRVEVRLYAEAEEADPGSLDGIDGVREDFQRLTAGAVETLSLSFGSADGGTTSVELEPGQVVERYTVLERMMAEGQSLLPVVDDSVFLGLVRQDNLLRFAQTRASLKI